MARAVPSPAARRGTASRKTVAIKRILPHLASNAEFTTMFIDEAKLASQLNHPNIAQKPSGLARWMAPTYIAMEFVDGRGPCARSRPGADREGQAHGHAGRRRAGGQVGGGGGGGGVVLAALDHAHRKKDEAGRSLTLGASRTCPPQNPPRLHRRRDQAGRFRHRQGRLQGLAPPTPALALKGKACFT
jgi:hypothetical protein